MPGFKKNGNGIDNFFKTRPSKNNIREGETVSFLENGNLVKQEKRNGIVYESVFSELSKDDVVTKTQRTSTSSGTVFFSPGSTGSESSSGITSVVAGTGLTGGGASGPVSLNVIGGTGITANANDIAIDSTVTTLTGSQTLTNKTLTSPVINTGVSGTAILDENNMASDSDTKLATQQSIKAYVDSEISGIAAPANATITLSPGAGLAAIGDFTTNQSSNETLTIAVDGVLEDLDTLGAAASDGQFIVATGSGAFAYESGSTARTSLGLGDLATLNSIGDSQVASDANIAITKLAASSITVADGSSNTAISLGNTITFSGTSNEVTVGESSGTITVGLPDDVTISGDLTVNGDVVTVTAENIVVQDPLIKLAKDNNSSDSLDIGFYGLYDTSGSQDLYAGLFRDANDSGKFKLFKDLQAEPTTTVNISGTGYAKATLVADLEGNVTGNASGNAGTATALATGRDFSLSGDVTGTTSSVFDGTGNATITATIASTAVEGSMLNNNVISGQTDMTGDVDDADELMISDAGTLKRIDFSVLRDAVYNDVSGDATIADGGALTIANNSVALGTDTTGNYVATVADSGTGGITVANSGSESAAVTVELDINGLTAATLASGDFLAFSDESATGDPTKKESIDDIATLFAGAGLTASSAVINLDITGFDAIAEGALAEASDVMLVYDDDAGVNKKITIEDLEDAIGGTGTVTNIATENGITGGSITSTGTLGLDFSTLTDMTGDIAGTTEFILQNGTTESRKAASEIKLSYFNNNSGWTSNAGTVTSVTVTGGDGLTGGGSAITSSGTATLAVGSSSLAVSSNAVDIAYSALSTVAQTIATGDHLIFFDASNSNAVQIGPVSDLPFTNNSGTVTNVVAGTGLSGGGTTTATLDLDFSELTDMTGDISGSTEFILQDGTTESRKAASEIKLSNFNNDSGFVTANTMGSGFVLEDGDGTEVTITENKEVKFIDGTGMQINWSNTSNGTDADPYDLTFELDVDGLTLLNEAPADADTFILYDDSASAIKKVPASEVGSDTTYSAGSGLDLSSTTFSVDVSDFMANGANNYIVTATGTDAMNAEANLTFDGTNLDLPDSKYIRLGNGNDFYLQHDGTNSYLRTDTGDLYLQNANSDGDVFIRVNDGGSTINAIQVDTSETGKVRLPNDGQTLSLGAGNDLTFQHDGSNSYIGNGVGNLYISNDTDDGDIILRSDDGSNGTTAYLTLDGSATKVQIDKNMVFSDDVQAQFGGNVDLRIYSDDSNSYIDNENNNLIIQNDATDGDINLKSDNGSGGLATYIQLDGGNVQTQIHKQMRFLDNVNLRIGSGTDLTLYHDGTNSSIENHTGNLYIDNNTNDGEIIFRCDDGSGGVTQYFALNGTNTRIDVNKNTIFEEEVFLKDDKDLVLGNGSDLQIRHDNSSGQGWIRNYTDHLVIENNADDHDIIFKTDNGSGGTATYLTLDGSAESVVFGAVDLKLPATQKLYLDGGGNTYITESSADRIKIFVGGSELVNIIEDTTSLFRLSDDVQGTFGNADDIKIYHNSSSGNANIENHTGSLYVTNYTNDADIIFRTDDGSGGTTAYLTLDGSAGLTQIDKTMKFVDSVQLQVGSSSDAAFYHDGSNTSLQNNTGALYVNNVANASMHLNTNNTSAMTIDNSQRVGIGTTSPSTKLEVASGNSGGDAALDSPTIRLNNTTQSTDWDTGDVVGTLEFYSEDASGNAPYVTSFIKSVNETGNGTLPGGALTFGVADYNASGGAAEAMRITEDSNVGIGTTSPSQPLHTHGTAGDTRTRISTSNHGTYFESGVTADSAGIILVAGHNSSILNIYLQNSGGSASNEFQFQHDGDFHADGDVVAYSTTVSDKRLKDNVKTIDNALDKVMKLRGVEFDWNQGKRKGTHDLGLIAQEVEEVLPELVRDKTLCTGEHSEGNEKEFKTVDYDKIVGVLIEAVKEQQEEIDLLKANFDQLKYNRR